MRTLTLLTGTGCLLLGFVLVLRADDDPTCRAAVAKAIKAHGGEANLKKAKAATVKANGVLDFMNGTKFTTETCAQHPDKFKNVIGIEVNNMNLTITQVYDGKSFWINVAGQTMEFKDAKDLAELKENLYLEKLGDLVSLSEKGIELSPLGEVKVDNQDCVGVRASSKGHRDLNLFFAKKSGLLLKTEARVYDLQTKQEVGQEKIYSDYKDEGGIMTPRQVVVNQDGKRHVTVEVTSVKYSDRHDDSIFAKPE
jgi:hypothetical protein